MMDRKFKTEGPTDLTDIASPLLRVEMAWASSAFTHSPGLSSQQQHSSYAQGHPACSLGMFQPERPEIGSMLAQRELQECKKVPTMLTTPSPRLGL